MVVLAQPLGPVFPQGQQGHPSVHEMGSGWGCCSGGGLLNTLGLHVTSLLSTGSEE